MEDIVIKQDSIAYIFDLLVKPGHGLEAGSVHLATDVPHSFE